MFFVCIFFGHVFCPSENGEFLVVRLGSTEPLGHANLAELVYEATTSREEVDFFLQRMRDGMNEGLSMEEILRANE